MDRYNLMIWQRRCPICSKSITQWDHLHHWAIGRIKGKICLDEPGFNLLLLHPDCHVPPPPDLDYLCAKFVFMNMDIHPEQMEAWREGLNFKVLPSFSKGYYRAREEAFGH